MIHDSKTESAGSPDEAGGIVGTLKLFARDMMHQAFADAVFTAAARPEVREAVSRLYEQVTQEINARRPLCVVSGRCCRFEEFGHRLYVTTMELARFVYDLPHVSFETQTDEKACPLQSARLCTVHSIRPFGCRMFFCDATSTEWQNQRYEQFHSELKRMHEELDVPYSYIEWREALRLLRVV